MFMIATPPLPSSPPAEAPPAAQPGAPQTHAQNPAARHADTLAELVDIGMALARLVDGQAHALTRTQPQDKIGQHLPHLTKAFDRLARTVRQTVALDIRLAEPPPGPAAATRALHAARRHIIRRIEDAIEDRAPRPERENLLRDLYERLDDPEFDEALLTTDAKLLFVNLTTDLGIPNPFSTKVSPRSQAAIAALNARAARRTPVRTVNDTPMRPVNDTPVRPVDDTPVRPVDDTPVRTAHDTPAQPPAPIPSG